MEMPRLLLCAHLAVSASDKFALVNWIRDFINIPLPTIYSQGFLVRKLINSPQEIAFR